MADFVAVQEAKQHRRASPVSALIWIRERRSDGLVASMVVDPSEAVLAGHFPGFPIFPGVCLIDRVHRAALTVLPSAARLVAMDSARFLAPVFPGDEITFNLTVDGTICSATVRVRRSDGHQEDVALVRLRFRIEELNGHR